MLRTTKGALYLFLEQEEQSKTMLLTYTWNIIMKGEAMLPVPYLFIF